MAAVSVIVPILNGSRWIDSCFKSIIEQSAPAKGLKIEISIFDDGSTDDTDVIIKTWKDKFEDRGYLFKFSSNSTGTPKGVGYAKNMAVKSSCGTYLCFQDVDDVMLPDRIIKQFVVAEKNQNSIVGSKFSRIPANSTERYTVWANNLTSEKLNIQIYTAHGPTVIMPTWFLHRNVYNRVGGFSEDGKGTPEDLIFFYKHINLGGSIVRVDDILLTYTYHENATTFSISSDVIWNIRIKQFIEYFLPKCKDGFTIWNAGKQGRKFLRSITDDQRNLVKAFCDVDIKKIGTHYEMYCSKERRIIKKIPIIHFSEAKPPLVICIKLDLTDGEFEKNLNSLNLNEGTDYILFS